MERRNFRTGQCAIIKGDLVQQTLKTIVTGGVCITKSQRVIEGFAMIGARCERDPVDVDQGYAAIMGQRNMRPGKKWNTGYR